MSLVAFVLQGWSQALDNSPYKGNLKFGVKRKLMFGNP